MAPNPKGCRALAMPQRQQSEYPVFQHREIHAHRIILHTTRPACAAGSPPDGMRCYQPPTAGKAPIGQDGGFDIPDGQTNTGAA